MGQLNRQHSNPHQPLGRVRLASARILCSEKKGLRQSTTGRLTILIFLSDQGTLQYVRDGKTTNTKIAIGTTVLINDKSDCQSATWPAPNRLVEIAVEESFVNGILDSVKYQGKLSNILGIYGPHAGFAQVAKRIEWQCSMHSLLHASLINHGLHCAAQAHFLVAMMMNFRSEQCDSNAQNNNELSKSKLTAVIDHIESELGSNIQVSEIAAIAAQSRFHFARTFKRATGRSPHLYIIDSRLRRAESLLAESDYSLSQIANESGFNSQSHFTTVFRKRIGLTPAQYRRLSL